MPLIQIQKNVRKYAEFVTKNMRHILYMHMPHVCRTCAAYTCPGWLKIKCFTKCNVISRQPLETFAIKILGFKGKAFPT